MESALTSHQQALLAMWRRAHHLPPLGYLCRNRTDGFVTDPAVFPVVQQIWKLAIEGRTITEIVVEVNDRMQFLTPIRGKTGGRPLSRMGIRNILRDPTYTGRIRWRGGLYGARHPRAVSDEYFARVQSMLSSRNPRRNGTAGPRSRDNQG